MKGQDQWKHDVTLNSWPQCAEKLPIFKVDYLNSYEKAKVEGRRHQLYTFANTAANRPEGQYTVVRLHHLDRLTNHRTYTDERGRIRMASREEGR
jgi:hypothetical protein